MSIATAIQAAQNKIAAAYTKCNDKGATMPVNQNLANLADCIDSIPGGSNFDDWVLDGNTHVWINILNPHQCYQELHMRFTGTIDWGDGTTENVADSAATTHSHTYAAVGKYRIDLAPANNTTFSIGRADQSYNLMGKIADSDKFRTSVLYQFEYGSKVIAETCNYALSNSVSLRRVYVGGIKTISRNSFLSCTGLSEVIFADASKITNTGLNETFPYCSNLQKVSGLTPGITSMDRTYRACTSLTEITIPVNVATIAAYTMSAAYGLKRLRCLPTSPPTLANSALSNVPADCVIEVPRGSLSAYQGANNWSTYASQMVEASQ